MNIPDTTQYNFEQPIDRRGSDSIKWAYYDDDILPMWVADMDFVSPTPVLEALRKRIDQGVFGYPQEPPALRQIIVDRMLRAYNWHIEPTDILPLPCVVNGFNLACHTTAKPDEAVLIQTPVYPPILQAAKATGIQGHEMELTRQPDGTYSVDWDLFEESIQTNSRLFILCNPHNPVGKVFTKNELEQIAEICTRHDVIICSDEIHSDLLFQGHTHIPIAAIDEEVAQRTITLISPTKTYNLPSVGCGFAIIQNEELRERYINAKAGLMPAVNLLGFVAAQAAYQFGDPWLEQLLAYLEANRDYLISTMEHEFPQIHVGRPEGTYLAWLDCRQSDIEGNPHKFFLKQGRVAFNDGETFGNGGQGFVRLNFGCPRSTLTEAMDRLRLALNSR